MSLHTRLDALKERHATLETRILDEDQRREISNPLIPRALFRSDLAP